MTYPFKKKKKREREREKIRKRARRRTKKKGGGLIHSFDLVDGKLYFFYFLRDKTAEGN